MYFVFDVFTLYLLCVASCTLFFIMYIKVCCSPRVYNNILFSIEATCYVYPSWNVGVSVSVDVLYLLLPLKKTSGIVKCLVKTCSCEHSGYIV